MNRKLVSIIVPVYNAAKYLNRCIDSVQSQTYPNFELLLINDGSTDSSLDICNKYAKNNDSIKVLSIENSGPSVARNVGIEKSSGSFIYFLDSDDYIESTMIEKMVSSFEHNNCDLVVCGHTAVYPDHSIGRTLTDRQYDFNEFIKSFGNYYAKNIIQYVWNKLFSAKIIKNNNLCFSPDTRRGEDALFVIDYLNYCYKITTISEKLYYYVNNMESLTLNYNPHLLEDQQRVFLKIRTFLSNHAAYEKNESVIENTYAHRIISCFSNIFIRPNTLSFQDKLLETRRIIESDDFKKSFKYYKPQRIYQKIIKYFIMNKMVLCTACAFSLLKVYRRIKSV